MNLLSKLLTKISSYLPFRVFSSDVTKKPYLTRFRILSFKDTYLNLHFFHRSDEDQELHSHPWKWAVSVILTGGYTEERRDNKSGIIWSRHFLPGMVNFLRNDTYHRVDLIDQEEGCWTLFLTGPKASTWFFWNRETNRTTPWRTFLREKLMFSKLAGDA